MKGVRGPHTNLGNTGQAALACGVSPPAHDVQPGKSTTSPEPARTGPPASGTRMPPPPLSRAGLATSRPETHSLLHVPMSPVALLGPQGQQCCRTEWHLTQRLSGCRGGDGPDGLLIPSLCSWDIPAPPSGHRGRHCPTLTLSWHSHLYTQNKS